MRRNEIEDAAKWLESYRNYVLSIERLENALDEHMSKCQHWSIRHVPRATAECDPYNECEFCGKEIELV